MSRAKSFFADLLDSMKQVMSLHHHVDSENSAKYSEIDKPLETLSNLILSLEINDNVHELSLAVKGKCPAFIDADALI